MRQPKLVFIIGAPRSGTTWLQLMLGAHPAIATAQESQVFYEYLAPLARRWQEELAFDRSEDVRQHGIATHLTEEEFLDLLRRFALGVFEKSARQKPDARYFLEKSPNCTLHVDLIHRCFPEARFIHVLRDGRDVVASLLMASRDWAKSWAPRTTEHGADVWCEYVLSARRAARLSEHYLEVRYEDLHANGVGELQRIFDLLDLEASPRELESIYNRFTFDELSRNRRGPGVFVQSGAVPASGTQQRAEPAGFFRKGKVGGWRDTLSRSDVNIVNWVAGDILLALGYASAAEIETPAIPPIDFAARRGVETCIGVMKGWLKPRSIAALQRIRSRM